MVARRQSRRIHTNKRQHNPQKQLDDCPIGLFRRYERRDEHIPNSELGIAGGSPVWSQDGKSLFQVIKDSKGIRSLYRVDLKTGEFRQLAELAVSSPISSHEGTNLFQVTQDSKGMRSLYRIDLKTGESTQVTENVGNNSRVIELSSDDKTLYMIDGPQAPGRGSETCAMHSIVAIGLSSGRQKEIVSLPRANK